MKRLVLKYSASCPPYGSWVLVWRRPLFCVAGQLVLVVLDSWFLGSCVAAQEFFALQAYHMFVCANVHQLSRCGKRCLFIRCASTHVSMVNVIFVYFGFGFWNAGMSRQRMNLECQKKPQKQQLTCPMSHTSLDAHGFCFHAVFDAGKEWEGTRMRVFLFMDASPFCTG